MKYCDECGNQLIFKENEQGYFCKKLSFRTTYKGEEFASEIVFDIDKIKAILNDENDKRDGTTRQDNNAKNR